MNKGFWFWAIIIIFFVLGFFGAKKLIVGSNEKLTRQYDDLFNKYGSRYGISPRLLKAIALNESSLGKNKGYEPKGGTTGLMQIKLSTAKDFFPQLTASELEKDEVQVMTASAFLASLKKQFNGDERKMVMAYNQGAGATRQGKMYASGYYEKYEKHKKLVG